MEFVPNISAWNACPDTEFTAHSATIDVEIGPDRELIRIELHPNERMNRRALLFCVLFLTFTVLAIGIIFALFGAWFVLPFAGLEILVLATGTLMVCSRTDDADSLVISKNYVHLKQRRGSIQSVNSFIRNWTKFQLMPGKTGHEPSRLLVVCRANNLEIGEFLIESSRRRLYQLLTEWTRNNV